MFSLSPEALFFTFSGGEIPCSIKNVFTVHRRMVIHWPLKFLSVFFAPTLIGPDRFNFQQAINQEA